MRRTKIIATLGPATETPEILTQLIQSGVNLFRFNMSHAQHDWVKKIASDVRQISEKLNRPIGLLLDTQGPAIRTGDLDTNLHLKVGDIFTFTVRGETSPEERSVDVNYDNLVNDIRIGDVVLVDNGVIHMKVLSKETNRLRCEVLTPGTLTSRRHINLPGVHINLPALTEKDIADVQIAIDLQFDFVALSFVREANDILQLRNLITSKTSHPIRIVAKIEDQSAISNLDSIVETADAIMVARGDLGIECPYEELPIIQRRIVKKSIQTMKPVIVATHMLESMIQNPLPTRAEVTDVANAVYEQADAIMLSGETSVGRYPKKCIEVMDRIAYRTEISGGANFADTIHLSQPRESVVNSAIHLANNLRADALVVFTRGGRIASIASALRPRYTPIFAFTPDEKLMHRLCLYYGVIPIHLTFPEKLEDTIATALQWLKQHQNLPLGSKLVVISDILAGEEVINSVQLHTLN
ncbi:MAG: pyruvate kinase [Verrucomicrobiae bacterium]|nr:pyruvate kinase [Verrucomicrobiae bacterium]